MYFYNFVYSTDREIWEEHFVCFEEEDLIQIPESPMQSSGSDDNLARYD